MVGIHTGKWTDYTFLSFSNSICYFSIITCKIFSCKWGLSNNLLIWFPVVQTISLLGIYNVPYKSCVELFSALMKMLDLPFWRKERKFPFIYCSACARMLKSMPWGNGHLNNRINEKYLKIQSMDGIKAESDFNYCHYINLSWSLHQSD